jgi:predicted dehydrogenase
MPRIGLIGCGVVADYGHIPAILSTPGLELVGVCDVNAAKAEATSRKFGIPHHFADQDRLFELNLDGVVISSSAPAHMKNVMGASRYRTHVLCEKPLALSDTDAEAMIAAVEATGKMLLVGYVYRFSPVATQIKTWLQDGLIGDPKMLRFVYLWDLHGQYERTEDGEWVESPRWRGRMLEGGPMIDCGVHMIDLARWWTGAEVVSFEAHGAWVSNYAAPDHMFLHLDHERGISSSVEMSFTYGHTARDPAALFSYDVIGDGGAIRYDRDGWRLEARTGSETVRGAGASEKNFPGMYQEFLHALESGTPGHFPTGRDGLIATQIAESATAQAIQKRASLE